MALVNDPFNYSFISPLFRTFMLAGHDTTASTISWLLLELSRNPADQIRMREEIAAARARIGAADFTIADLDELQWVNACIRVREYFLSFILDINCLVGGPAIPSHSSDTCSSCWTRRRYSPSISYNNHFGRNNFRDTR